MKKKLITILSFFAALLFALAVAACGEEEAPTKYTVTLDPGYEGGAVVTREYEAGASLEQPESPAAPEGKVFSLWSYDEAGQQPVQFPVTVEADLSLHAQWRTAQRFTLKFSVRGATAGAAAPSDIVGYEGATVTLPAGDGIERDFYVLTGWKAGDDTYALGAEYTIVGDVAFSPVWTRAVTVRFAANGATGEAPAEMAAPVNSSITLPAQGALSKEGYTFDGWLDENYTLISAGDTVQLGDAETVTFKAAWNGEYNITYDIALKSTGVLTTRQTGLKIILAEAAEIEEMEFMGWSYRGQTYAANTMFTMGYEDVHFEAVLRKLGTTVEFYDADHSLIRSEFYPKGQAIVAPADLYPLALSEFTGWVDVAGEPVELSSVQGETVAVYAAYSVQFADTSLFTYRTYQGGYLISGKSNTYRPSYYASLNLPVAYNGKPIYGIAAGSGTQTGLFASDSYLKTVRIPSNWTQIGSYAFYKSGLTGVTFAENGKLDSIGYAAFSESGLTQISVPDSVTTVGRDAFSKCASLRTATFGQESGITAFSDGTENERSSIFANCTSLTDVTLPGHLEVIGLMAFQYCPIETITLPASMRILGQSAFDHCDKLQTVVIPEDCRLEEVQRAAFGWCKALQKIDLPETVRSIAYNAFTSCEVMESITFGNVTEIGETAFFRCYALKRVNSETDGAFNLPASLREIGIGAFAMCSEMQQVNFGAESELKTVGMYAFAANLYHDADHYPDGIEHGDYGYDSVSMSLESIEFPAGVETIGKYVLYNVFSLQTLTVAAGNSHYTADGRGLYENATHKLIAFALGSEETSYTLASDCVAMDEYVLSGDMREATVYGTPKVQEVTLSQGLKVLPYTSFLCHAELTKIVVPAGSELTTIEEAAFANCIKLASFNFEAATKLQTIGVEAFEDAAFTAITLPASLKEIGNYAFYKADLETVDFAAESVLETLGVGAFMGNDHIKAEGSTEFIGSNLRTFTLPKGVVSVGTMAFAYTTSLETFTFEEGSQLTGFANNMFQWSAVQRIENIPESLAGIGESAFARTSRLTTFEMNTVGSIGLYAFSNSAIQTVTLRGTFDTLTVRTFDTCKDLVSVTLGESVKSIGNWAFTNCTSLEEIALPASCTSLGVNVFDGCTAFSRITLNAATVVTTTTSTFGTSGPTASGPEEVYVPAELVERYKASSFWIGYTDRIQPIAG